MSDAAPKPCGSRYPRWIDRAFVRGISRRRGRLLRRHVEGCRFCRARYDRLAHASAALSGEPLGADTLVYIGDDVVSSAASWHVGRRFWFAGATVAAAAAALLLLVYLPANPEEPEFGARGSESLWQGDRAPGVRLFCLEPDGGGARVVGESRLTEPDVPSTALRCTIAGELQLAYSTPSLSRLTMVAFGYSEEGRTLYYAPRQAGAESLPVAPERIDEPLAWSTRLAVKHEPGGYRVFVRFYDQPVTASAAAGGAVEPIWEVTGRLEVTAGGETP